MQPAVIGVDIGGTKIAAHVSDANYKSYFERQIAVPEQSKSGVLAGLAIDSQAYQIACETGRAVMFETVANLCRDLIAEAERENLLIKAVGIGSTGQIDPKKGMVIDANPNIAGWTGARITENIGAALKLPVYLENDVRVMALAESVLGAGKDYRHILCITVGTGIGGAIVLNGELWHGAHYSAGEIGYTYVSDGETLETLYAGSSIAKHYNRKHGTGYTLRDIAEKADEGDQSCIDAIVHAAEMSGKYIAPFIGMLDPGAVIIGGGVPDIGDLWWQPFTGAISKFYLKSVRETPILKAETGNRAGMIGASILAIRKAKI